MTLIGYWPLNEDSGASEAKDHSGNENHGTIYDGGDSIIPGSTGILGQKAYSFDGANDYVGNMDLNSEIGNEITVSVWIKASSFSDSRYQGFVTEKYDPDQDDVVFEVFYDGEKDEYLAGFYDGSWHKVSGSTDTETGVWKHIVGTYDGSNLRLFEEGIVVDEKSDTSGLPYGDNKWEFGRRHDNYSESKNYWNGKIQGARIYNHALTPSEVQYLYSVSQRGQQTTSKKRS